MRVASTAWIRLRTCFLLVYSALAASILPVATGIGMHVNRSPHAQHGWFNVEGVARSIVMSPTIYLV
jgi:hypothetical protein